MHIRPRPWARPELLSCGYFIEDCRSQKGKWQDAFTQRQPLYLELGCGKGSFLAAQGVRHPDINFLGIDMIDAMLGLSKRNIEATYQQAHKATDNIRLTLWNITRISDILAPSDTVSRIYINFCNPWPKRRHHKKRLTHPRQLALYKTFMAPEAEIHFKTDSDELFEASLRYFEAEDFEVLSLTRDLHAENDPDNIITEHERMFSEQGIPIKRVIVRQKK